MTAEPPAERGSDQHPPQQRILDEAPANIYVKDVHGRYLFVNAGLTSRLGIARERMLGHTDEEVFGPEQAAAWRENDLRGLDNEIEEIEHIGNPLRAVYRSMKFPLRDPAGAPYAVCGISLDVTGSYRAEQARAAAERRVVALESVDSLGRFAGGMAHDLKNSLAAVLALTDLAIEDAARWPGERGQRLVETVGDARDAVLRCTDQIERMLAATTPSPVVPRPVHLEVILDRLRPVLAAAAGSTRLHEAVPAGLPVLLVDAGDVERILLNLVTNAAEAGGAEGTVVVAASATTVEPPVDGDVGVPDVIPGDYVRIDIVDDGPGMAPDVLERALQPLFTTKSRGSGLGLWSAYAMALRGHGALCLTSTRGAGTTASLWVPTSPAPIGPRQQVSTRLRK